MGIMRGIVERLSRNRVLKRRLPADLGRAALYVSPDASLTFWRPGLRSDLFDLARQHVKPGDVVWDVGANVGLLSFAAAARAGARGRVIALEPDLWLAQLLRRSARCQPAGCAPVDVLPAAVSDCVGIAEFNIAQRGRAANYLNTATGSTQTGGVRETVQVMTITLDWLLDHRPAPRLVKIDVERAEVGVLRGASRLLREIRPILLVETESRTQEAVTQILNSASYTLYDWDSPSRQRIAKAAFNTLAIPAA